jgi:hypothetical protein
MNRSSTTELRSQKVLILVVAGMAVAAAACGSGGSDTTGGGGAGGSGAPCDAKPIFVKYQCTVPGACHDAAGAAANLDMVTAGWETKLVGKAPPGGGAVPSKCGGMNQVYLTAGSKPATGLFIDKLAKAHPQCGVQMPNLANGPITAAELACVTSWATALTSP